MGFVNNNMENFMKRATADFWTELKNVTSILGIPKLHCHFKRKNEDPMTSNMPAKMVSVDEIIKKKKEFYVFNNVIDVSLERMENMIKYCKISHHVKSTFKKSQVVVAASFGNAITDWHEDSENGGYLLMIHGGLVRVFFKKDNSQDIFFNLTTRYDKIMIARNVSHCMWSTGQCLCVGFVEEKFLIKPKDLVKNKTPSCLLYTSPSPRDQRGSRMPSSA